jgi:hypothetical protein
MREITDEGRCSGGIVHPVFISALIVLVLNDHWAKAHWPGIVTGKLSDFAGVVVFPIVLATLFLRVRVSSDRNWAWGVGAGAAVLLFLTKNLDQAGADFLAGVLRVLFSHSRMTADTTDLVALLALPVSLFTWQSAWQPPQKRASRQALKLAFPDRSRTVLRHIVLGLSVFACAATSEVPTYQGRAVAPHLSVNNGTIRILVAAADQSGRQFNSVNKQAGDVVLLESSDGGDTWSQGATLGSTLVTSVTPTGSTCRGPARRDPCYFIDPKFDSGTALRSSLIEQSGGKARRVWSHQLDPKRVERGVDTSKVQPFDVESAARLTDVIQLDDGAPIALLWPTKVVIQRNGRWVTRSINGLARNHGANLLDGPEFASLLIPSILLSFALLLLVSRGARGCGVAMLWFGFIAGSVVSLTGVGASTPGSLVPTAWLAALGAVLFSALNLVLALARGGRAFLCVIGPLSSFVGFILWLQWSSSGSLSYTHTRTVVLVVVLGGHAVAIGAALWEGLMTHLAPPDRSDPPYPPVMQMGSGR